MSTAQKFGSILSEIRKPYDEATSDAKKAGKLLHTLGELTATKGIMAEILQFAMNQKLSIDDRVEKMNMMLVLINSLPHAKPDNAAWDEAYTGFRGLVQFWKVYKSQRFFFSDYAMAEVEEFVEKKVKEKDDKGNEKTVDKSGWNTRTIDPTTALEMLLTQPARPDPTSDEPFPGEVNILRTIRNPIPSAFQDMAFTKEFAEWCVTSFGEVVMLETIFVLLNYAYNEFNVPANTILMLNAMMQGQQGQTTLHVTAQTEESQSI